MRTSQRGICGEGSREGVVAAGAGREFGRAESFSCSASPRLRL